MVHSLCLLPKSRMVSASLYFYFSMFDMRRPILVLSLFRHFQLNHGSSYPGLRSSVMSEFLWYRPQAVGMLGIFCLLSCRDVVALLTPGGAIPAKRYTLPTEVGFRHPVMQRHASFRTGSSLLTCVAFSTQNTHIPPHLVHSRCSGLRNAAEYRKANGWICTDCMTPPQPRAPSPPHSPAHTPTMSDKTFNILQWNANGIGNKQMELGIFLEAHDVKVAVIQESKLTAKSRSPNIQNYTLVRQDRHQGPGGGLLFFIHNSVSFNRKPQSKRRRMTPT